MQKTFVALIGCIISLLIIVSSSQAAPNLVGKWEMIRVEYLDGKGKPPQKPKMGGAEFFQDQKVMFSDGLSGEWTTLPDGRLKITLMGIMEMFGSFEGDLLKLFTEINPNEIMVLKKQR